MNHWIIAPIVLPALMATLLVMPLRNHLGLQRIFSVAGAVLNLAIALGLMALAKTGEISVYDLGNWPAPFGIVLVLDNLAALMVVLATALGLVVAVYAAGSGWDARGKHFHPLFQFQMMGICGAFLTGDAFNLFVFFEVLLIASYGLMIHGGATRQLRAGVQYVAYNLLGSTLFLFALGTLYAVTGTLNMADMALRVAELPADQTALLRVGAVLLLMVFAVKAALLPLHFWLPETYANAPAPIAALFAIMTKVGAYAILRMDTLVFGPELTATAELVGLTLLGAALLTLIVGMLGVLGADSLGRLAAFAAIGSMGTLLAALAIFSEQATAAALYYLVHSTLAGAALFLVVDLVRARRGALSCRAVPGPKMAQGGLVAALYFAVAIAVAGMPPLSGFIGKLLVLDAVWGTAHGTLIWVVILATSLIAIVGLAQAGSAVFWKPAPEGEDGFIAYASPESAAQIMPPPVGVPVAVLGVVLAGIVALTVFAAPVMSYLETTATQLYAPHAYIDAVMARSREGS